MELWYTHTHCVWCSININLSNSQRNISQVSFALPFWFSALFAAASSVLAKGVTISALGCLGSGVMMRSSPALPALSYQRLEKNIEKLNNISSSMLNWHWNLASAPHDSPCLLGNFRHVLNALLILAPANMWKYMAGIDWATMELKQPNI